jgi:hypothetical protein
MFRWGPTPIIRGTVLFKRMRRRVAEDVSSRLGAGRIVAIDEGANSFGVESKGVAQVRGNGCLAATAEEILFLMWFPRKELRIPRNRIIAVEQPRSHLGKSYGGPLLKIHFTDDQGKPDSVAWAVNDLPMWAALLGRP